MNKSEIDKIYIGIKKSLNNSLSLIDDADYLFNNDRFSRAYTLYQLGIEEIGKTSIMYRALLSVLVGENVDFKTAIKRIKSHKEKEAESLLYDFWILIHAMQNDNIFNKDYFTAIAWELYNPEIINNYKNFSLYTSEIDNCFYEPKEIINKGIVDDIKFRAKTRMDLVKTIIDTYLLNSCDNFIDSIEKLKENQTIYNKDADLNTSEIIEKIKNAYGMK